MTKTTPDNLRTLKHKLYIGYLYFKRYVLWIFLALFLLFVLNIIVKNMGNTTNPTSNQSNNTSTIKKLVVKANRVKPVKEIPSVNSAEFESLKQQLLAEKEKNRKLENTLNNQELQITSALDEINQSFQTFNNKPQKSNNITVLTGTSNDQTAYYNKVKAALSKITPRNTTGVEKLSTTSDNNSQENMAKNEG